MLRHCCGRVARQAGAGGLGVQRGVPTVASWAGRGLAPFCTTSSGNLDAQAEKLVAQKVSDLKQRTGALYTAYEDKIRKALEEKARRGELGAQKGPQTEQGPTPSSASKTPTAGAAVTNAPTSSSWKQATSEASRGATSGANQTQNGAQALDSIMKISMLQSESAATITDLWKKYHVEKDFIFGATDMVTYAGLKERLTECPRFLFPIPREGGMEFQYMEAQGHQVVFTKLQEYQLHQENARPFLSVTHYVDLADAKNLVLMRGEVDMDRSTVAEAQTLYNQLQIFYMSKDKAHRDIVHAFNHKQSDFDYNKVISLVERPY